VLETAGTLIQAHPAMASFYNFFTRILMQLDRVPSGPEAAEGVHLVAETFIREMKDHNRMISAHLLKLIKPNDILLTHSASRSVREALLYCWRRGKRFSIICSESRPACEGTLLARRLSQQGIPTSLTTDALGISILRAPAERNKRITLVLVGADSVSPAGLTNKAGTLGLAMVAKQCSIPFYALAGSEKFLPASFPVERAIQDKPSAEILARPPKGLKVINRYFDITPLSYLTAVITEKGPLTFLEIKKHLKKLNFHPRLNAALKMVKGN